MQPQTPPNGPYQPGPPGGTPQPPLPQPAAYSPPPAPGSGAIPPPAFPAAPQPHAEPTDYEFIINPAKPKPKVALFGGGSGKLFLVVVGLLVVLLLVGALALFNRGGDQGTLTYLGIARQQAELQRISAFAISQQEVSRTAKATALMTNMTLATDQAKLNAYLAEGGVSFEEEQLALGQDAEAAKTLESSLSTGTFETAFTTIMEQKLAAYQQSLQQAYTQVSNPAGKEILSASYDHAKLLSQQVKPN